MPLVNNAILIVGAPRSGTTWLAKVLDSHPDTLYRHEPDEVVTANGPIAERLAVWSRQHDARTAGKRPFFAKSWQSAPARWLRTGAVYLGAAAERIGLPAPSVPDLGHTGRARLVIKSVRLCDSVDAFARAFPAGRVLLILRHPCGQVASVMRGARDGRFDLAEAGTDMPFDEAAARRHAACFGVDEPAFQELPDAAKYAWSWRAFNETATAGIADRSNVRVVVYEHLCARPEAEARAIMAYCGLRPATEVDRFLALSTSFSGEAGYYAVVRNSIASADRWRKSMDTMDQLAVLTVARGSPLIHYWTDPLPAAEARPRATPKREA